MAKVVFGVRTRKKPKTAVGRLLYALEDWLFIRKITRSKPKHVEHTVVPEPEPEVAVTKEVMEDGSLNYRFKE